VGLHGRRRELQHQRVPYRPLILGAALLAGLGAIGVQAVGGNDRPVSFARQIQPIFDRKCTTCHPVSYPYLDLREGRSHAQLVRVSAATAPAFERVLPGRPELSYLLTHPPDPSLRDLLTTRERELIRTWVLEGARDN
jgi:hypothetical protein